MSEQEATLDKFTDGELPDSDKEVVPPTELTGVPDDWTAVNLGDIAKDEEGAFVDGPFGSNLKADEMSEEGYARIIQLQNIRSAEFIDSNHKYISREKFKELERHGAKPGDLAIAKMSKPVARACLLPEIEEQYLVVADCIKLSVDTSDHNSVFVMLALNSEPVWKQAFARSRGSTRKRINLTQLKEVQIPSPSLEEQRKIASILYTVDQAIQKSERIIRQRETVKEGLIQDIFRYGMTSSTDIRQSEEDNPYEKTKYGTVPEGWDVVPLDSVVSDDAPVTYGIVKPGDHHPGGVPVVKVENIIDGKIEDDNLLHTDPEIHEKYKRAELQEGDLLFTIRGTVGRMAFVPERLEGGNLTQDTARIRVEDADPRFIRYYFQSATPNNYFERHTKGQAVQGINLEDLREVPVHLPPEKEQKRIVEVLDSHTEQIQVERSHRDQLKRLKKGLMQDLLSGEVRTHDKDIEIVDKVLQHG